MYIHLYIVQSTPVMPDKENGGAIVSGRGTYSLRDGSGALHAHGKIIPWKPPISIFVYCVPKESQPSSTSAPICKACDGYLPTCWYELLCTEHSARRVLRHNPPAEMRCDFIRNKLALVVAMLTGRVGIEWGVDLFMPRFNGSDRKKSSWHFSESMPIAETRYLVSIIPPVMSP